MICTVSSSIVIQYIIVGLILLAAVAWIIVKIVKLKKNGAKSCCGCSVAASCPATTLEKEAQHKKAHASCRRDQATTCHECSLRSNKNTDTLSRP